MTTPLVDPRAQAEPLLRLAVETLRLAPPDMESLGFLSEEERAALLTPFMTAREQAREEAQSLAASGRLTADGLRAALEIAVVLAEGEPLLASELALLAGTAALALGGPPETVSWALALWSSAGARGRHALSGAALDVLGYAFESVEQGEACARTAMRAADSAMQAGWRDGALYSLRWARQAYADLGDARSAAACDSTEARLPREDDAGEA